MLFHKLKKFIKRLFCYHEYYDVYAFDKELPYKMLQCSKCGKYKYKSRRRINQWIK